MPIPGSLITAYIREALYYQEYLANVTKHRRIDGLKVADSNVNFESQKIPPENKKEYRECKASKLQDNMNRETPRRTVQFEDTTSNALVSQCDGLGYD
nr:hypothetical protein [Tanacetum cinerariifolium]